jgi:hypothetical protein
MSRFAPGNSKAAKLTNEQILEMRQKYEGGEYSQGRLAREFGISVNHVGRIVRGESRQSVPLISAEDAGASFERLQALLNSAMPKETISQVKADRIAAELMSDKAKEFGAK